MKTWFRSICVFAAIPRVFSISKLAYKAIPTEVWREPFNAVGVGNGVFLHNDEDLLAVVTANGNIRAYNAEGGQVLWTFTPVPKQSGGSLSCQSNIRFFEKNSQSYLLYAVMEELSGLTTSRILVLDSNGTKTMESVLLDGAVAGTPQVTSDGRYIAVTHNKNQKGHFSLLDTETLENNSTAKVLLTYESDLMVFNQSTPFSELGFFSQPESGFYDSPPLFNGKNNKNDLFLWMTDTNTDVTNSFGDPIAGQGQMYVFQFPRDYNHSGLGLEVIPIGNTRGFQSPTRPTFTDGGQSMYWGMVRGEVRAWVSQKFNRGQSFKANLGRGSPPYIAPRAPISLSHQLDSSDDRMVFGVGSSNMVWKAFSDLSNLTTADTDDIVTHQVEVTIDNQYAIYGTNSGTLTMANTDDLTPKWQMGSNFIVLNSIQGEMALTDTTLYLATNEGNGAGYVVGIQIADFASEVPSVAPSMRPSTSSPTLGPSQSPTSATPTSLPTTAPSTPAPTSMEPTKIALLTFPTTPPQDPPTAAPVLKSEQTERFQDKKTPSSSSAGPNDSMSIKFVLFVWVLGTWMMMM